MTATFARQRLLAAISNAKPMRRPRLITPMQFWVSKDTSSNGNARQVNSAARAISLCRRTCRVRRSMIQYPVARRRNKPCLILNRDVRFGAALWFAMFDKFDRSLGPNGDAVFEHGSSPLSSSRRLIGGSPDALPTTVHRFFDCSQPSRPKGG